MAAPRRLVSSGALPLVGLEALAALANGRVAVAQLHAAGVKTWVSIEPVMDAAQSLDCIRQSMPFVGAYKVGKLNHQRNTTDWRAFCIASVEMIRAAGRTLYVKDDLRPFAPSGFLRPAECDPETVFLPDRPASHTMPTAIPAGYLFATA